MKTTREMIDQLVEALQTLAIEIPDLQVFGPWNDTPSPPSIDVYPGTPFQSGAGMGVGQKEVFWTIRARVAMTDTESGQWLLLRMLDTNDPASVEAAVQDVATVTQDGVSGFTQYGDNSQGTVEMLGCDWRVSMFT